MPVRDRDEPRPNGPTPATPCWRWGRPPPPCARAGRPTTWPPTCGSGTNELLQLIGAFIPAFAGPLEARMAELKGRGRYAELVETVPPGPAARRSLFAIPAVDAAANDTEFLIHGMDVRRPNELPEPGPGRGVPALGVVAAVPGRRPDPAARQPGARSPWNGRDAPSVSSGSAGSGNRIVTVIGEPSELLLYAFGRRAAADVRLGGVGVRGRRGAGPVARGAGSHHQIVTAAARQAGQVGQHVRPGHRRGPAATTPARPR